MVVIKSGRHRHAQPLFDALAQIANDVPISPRIAHRLHRLAAALHAPVGVGKRAIFLGKTDRWQNHIGHFARFVDENVLANQKIQRFQRVTGMILIRFAHHRVFAQDKHRLHRAGRRAIHHFRRRQSRCGIEFDAPKILEFLLNVGIGHTLIGREDVGQTAAVRAALHIVLAAQRIQSGACFADVPAHQRQIDQRQRVVRAVRALADAHAPENRAPFGSGVQPRRLADLLRRDAADFLGPFRRVLLPAIRCIR